jgi:hypothetical protein
MGGELVVVAPQDGRQGVLSGALDTSRLLECDVRDTARYAIAIVRTCSRKNSRSAVAGSRRAAADWENSQHPQVD